MRLMGAVILGLSGRRSLCRFRLMGAFLRCHVGHGGVLGDGRKGHGGHAAARQYRECEPHVAAALGRTLTTRIMPACIW